MIGYTCVGTNNLDKAVAFYGELLGLMGAQVTFKGERGVGWGTAPDKPMFSVLMPFDKNDATVGNGSMVALAAKDPDQVHALHQKCIDLGGTCEGAPGPRSDGFYAAYFRDLDGNKLAAFCTTK
jgi:catechol 2,3-dioxygenase-like lactoylglutathione lyase family enzyme